MGKVGEAWKSSRLVCLLRPKEIERVWLEDAFKFPMIGQSYKNILVEFNHRELTNTYNYSLWPHPDSCQLAAIKTVFFLCESHEKS
jgi:hypothetical protein